MANQTIDVKKVAKLAHLELSDEQIKKLAPQLEEIVGYIAKLNGVETGHLEATARVTNLENVTNDDAVKPSMTQEEALSNAKEKEEGQFKVEAILENE